MTTAIDGLRTDLEKVLSRQWGEPVTLVDLRRLSGGASMETWAAVADGRRVILRRDRPGTPQSSRLDEAELLRRVRTAGVPVPEVLAAGADDELGAACLVMDFVEGETIPRKLLRDAAFATARTALVGQVGAALAAIHTVDAGFLGAPRSAEQQVRGLAELIAAHGLASPVFELALRRLLAHLPRPVAPTLVHGDLRTGNLMVGPDGLVAVLDWELAHPGDPAEDLAWFCVRAWRFGNDDKPAGGFGTRAELLAAYVAAGGRPVAPESLRFWETFGALKWGVTCRVQLAVHERREVRSVELAAIGRRIAEVEYDLVLLLEGSD